MAKGLFVARPQHQRHCMVKLIRDLVKFWLSKKRPLRKTNLELDHQGLGDYIVQVFLLCISLCQKD
jgi:hypothetical protein